LLFIFLENTVLLLLEVFLLQCFLLKSIKLLLHSEILARQPTNRGMGQCSCLRHWAATCEVVSSILDRVFEIFHWLYRTNHIMVLVSTQLLKKLIPEIFPGGKGGRCVDLTVLPIPCANWQYCESLPNGYLRACLDLYRDILSNYQPERTHQ
jgi:hypothetical protein